MLTLLLARLTPLQKDIMLVIAAAGFAGDTFRALSPLQATVIPGLMRLGIVVEQDQRWTLTPLGHEVTDALLASDFMPFTSLLYGDDDDEDEREPALA